MYITFLDSSSNLSAYLSKDKLIKEYKIFFPLSNSSDSIGLASPFSSLTAHSII